MKTSQVDAEVARLLQMASAPELRLPRTHASLQLTLMNSRGRGMSRDETALLGQATQLGVPARIGFEDLLLEGASVDVLEMFLEASAEEVAADLRDRFGTETGGEISRLLEQRRDGR